MVTDSSNQPGWGAKKGEGGGRIIEPVRAPTTYSGGYYTDSSGKQISQQEAMAQGTLDRPGEYEQKAASIGLTKQEYLMQSRQQGRSQEETQAGLRDISLAAMQKRILARDPNISISESIKQSRDVYNFLQATQRGGASFAPGAEQKAIRLASKLGSVPPYISYGYSNPTTEAYLQGKALERAGLFEDRIKSGQLYLNKLVQSRSIDFKEQYPGQFKKQKSYFSPAPIDQAGIKPTYKPKFGSLADMDEFKKSLHDFSSVGSSIQTAKNLLNVGLSTTPETLFYGTVAAAHKTGMGEVMRALKQPGITTTPGLIMGGVRAAYNKNTIGKEHTDIATDDYVNSVYKRAREFQSIPTAKGKAINVFFEHPATALIPFGAGWKVGATTAKYGLGRVASYARDIGKFGKPIEKSALFAAKHGETAAGLALIGSAYKDIKSEEEFIGVTASLASQLRGFRFGERAAVYGARSAGKMTGIVPESVVAETQIQMQSRTQVLEELINKKKIRTVTAMAGKGEKHLKIREPSPYKAGGIETGIPGGWGAPEIGGTFRYSTHFTNIDPIGQFGLQKNVDIMTLKTSVDGKAIEKKVLAGIKDGKDVSKLAKRYYELVQEEATRLDQPLAVLSPKTFAKYAHAENEVFIVYPKIKTVAQNKFVKILGFKDSTSENRIAIASKTLKGISEEGAPIREITVGKQPKVTSNFINEIIKNMKFNAKNIRGKEWLKKEQIIAERKIGEESGIYPMVPGTYGQHGIQHAISVLRKMGKWENLDAKEKKAAAMLHDITKIGDEASSGEKPFFHAQASARLIREGKITAKELEGLTPKQRLNVAKAIEQHTDIKPFTISGFRSDSLNVWKTLAARPSELSKALATADRMDLVRFGTPKNPVIPDPGLMWEPSKKSKTAPTKKGTKSKVSATQAPIVLSKAARTIKEIYKSYETKYTPRSSYAPQAAPYKQTGTYKPPTAPYTPKGVYKPPAASYKLFGEYTQKGGYKPPTAPYKVSGMYKLESIYHPKGEYKPGGKYKPGGEYKPGGDYKPPAPPKKILTPPPPPSFEAQLSMLDKLKKKRGRFTWDINNPIPTLSSLIGESEPTKKKKTKKSKK